MKDEKLYIPFAVGIWNTISAMSEVLFTPASDFYENKGDFLSYGATIIVGFSGVRKGRLLIDLEPHLALEMAQKINGEAYTSIDDPMVIATLSEIGNIVTGDGVTSINNEYSYKLRLVPPVVLVGEDMAMSLQKMEAYTMDFKSDNGKIKVNIAYERD